MTVAPPPPPGPGVQPPFIAPPTDGVRKRRWIALGLVAGALALCCAGGVTGVVSLGVLASRVLVQQERAAVSDYLTALRKTDYPAAYKLLCADRRAAQSLQEFTARQAGHPAIVAF